MKDCEWCTQGNEVCGTCRRFFGTCSSRCSAGAQERACFYYEPFGFCPKCGRKLKEDDKNEKSNEYGSQSC